MANKNSPHAG